ncbi:MAG: hypothetical protein Q9220_005478 [cf. Caloplaca sp. 1 TL-2023]
MFFPKPRASQDFDVASSGSSYHSIRSRRLDRRFSSWWQRKVRGHEQTATTDFEYDSETHRDDWSRGKVGHATGNWCKAEDLNRNGDWGVNDSWPRGCSTDSTLAATDEDEPTSPELLPFVHPLEDTLDDDGFLDAFLQQHRSIDISPDKKQQLAIFLHAICRDASYDFVASHDPDTLTRLRLKSADEIEFVTWITIIDGLRRQKRVPTDGSQWPNERIWFERDISIDDNIARLRQLAFHSRWEWDSRTIQHVLWYLDQLNDNKRRRQVADALQELYDNECRSHSELHHRPNSSQDLAPALTYSPPSQIDPPPQIATCNQFLEATQRTIAASLFAFAQRNFPSTLAYREMNSVADIEMIEYAREFSFNFRHSVPDEAVGRKLVHLLYAAADVRNAAAHCHDTILQQMQQEEQVVVSGWGNTDAEEVSLSSSSSSSSSCNEGHKTYTNGQTLTTILRDASAARTLRLVTWVANINFRASVKKTVEQNEARSIYDWKTLAAATTSEKKNWRDRSTEEVIRNRFEETEKWFYKEARAAEERCFGEEAVKIMGKWGWPLKIPGFDCEYMMR